MAPHHHAARIGRLRQPPDQGELRIGAVAPHDDLDPMTEPADVGITKPMVRAGDEALQRFVKTHARCQDEETRAEVAAPCEFIGRIGLVGAADLALTNLAERLLERQ